MNRHYESNNNRKRNRALILVALMVAAMILLPFLFLKGCEYEEPVQKPETTPIYLVDEGGSAEGEAQRTEREEILKELEKQQLIVTDKLSSNITFPSGEVGTVGSWIVENPEENSIIQQAEIYFGDELIAKSTPIYPNQHITGIELLSPIEPGEYEVTAYLNYYDIEKKEFISKAGYKIHMTVKE